MFCFKNNKNSHLLFMCTCRKSVPLLRFVSHKERNFSEYVALMVRRQLRLHQRVERFRMRGYAAHGIHTVLERTLDGGHKPRSFCFQVIGKGDNDRDQFVFRETPSRYNVAAIMIMTLR